MELTELIAQAHWREAVTYRETWPHEYVVIKKDKQEELLKAVCKRFCAGEGVDGRFFRMKNKYLFIGDYKYWLMTPCTEIDLKNDDYVLNRALIYRDRRDFLIRDGDDGRRDAVIDGVFGIAPSEYYNGAKANDNSLTGKLENVDVKSIWPNVAQDFTPWLAENIAQLGETLNMELEVEPRSSDFPLDILANDKFRGLTVAIYNQLEVSKQWHLGSILSYAGGFDARVLVWITSNLRDEHRAALDWLNRWTPEEIEIYGVEVRAVQIGDSKPAAEFVPVVVPNTWSKWARARSSGLSPVGFKNREFFQPLVDKLREVGFTDRYTAQARSYQYFPSGVSRIDYVASLEGGRKTWVYIPGWPTDFKQPIFDKLRADCESIERELELENYSDTSIDWCTPAGSIGVWRDGSLDDAEEELEAIRKWMFHYLIKFREVFNPVMQSIVDEMDNADD